MHAMYAAISFLSPTGLNSFSYTSLPSCVLLLEKEIFHRERKKNSSHYSGGKKNNIQHTAYMAHDNISCSGSELFVEINFSETTKAKDGKTV